MHNQVPMRGSSDSCIHCDCDCICLQCSIDVSPLGILTCGALSVQGIRERDWVGQRENRYDAEFFRSNQYSVPDSRIFQREQAHVPGVCKFSFDFPPSRLLYRKFRFRLTFPREPCYQVPVRPRRSLMSPLVSDAFLNPSRGIPVTAIG